MGKASLTPSSRANAKELCKYNMQEIFLNTIQDFNDYQGVETLHPLVSVVHVENTEHIRECVMHYGLMPSTSRRTRGANSLMAEHLTTLTR